MAIRVLSFIKNLPVDNDVGKITISTNVNRINIGGEKDVPRRNNNE